MPWRERKHHDEVSAATRLAQDVTPFDDGEDAFAPASQHDEGAEGSEEHCQRGRHAACDDGARDAHGGGGGGGFERAEDDEDDGVSNPVGASAAAWVAARHHLQLSSHQVRDAYPCSFVVVDVVDAARAPLPSYARCPLCCCCYYYCFALLLGMASGAFRACAVGAQASAAWDSLRPCCPCHSLSMATGSLSLLCGRVCVCVDVVILT